MSAAKVCAYCGEQPVDKGASRYCVGCKAAGKNASAKAAKRKPCRGCGGPKGDTRPGQSYCGPCREVRAPVNEQYESDRERQRLLDEERTLMEGRSKRRAHVEAPDGQKWCTRCERFLPLANFGNPSKSGKIRAHCLPCHRSYCHERNLRVTFGLTPAQYAAMYDAQGGLCAICLRRPRTTRLAVDHNHQTGEIRGLLCYRCNKQILGHAMESPSLLRRAANYLEAPPTRTGRPLEALDHFNDQARHVFADDAESVDSGAVVVNATGDLVAISFESLVALAQVAGIAMSIDGEQIELRDQMTTDDLSIVKRLWHSYQRQMGAVA